ncbi:MAG: phosphoribosylglycinamide formyltransferase [Acidobacteriota bacterium]|jgi:phosphoribosylglycinamide formyltransferase-1
MENNRKLAILLSGRGSNFIAIHEAIERRDLHASICCVISNVTDAPGAVRARGLGLTTLCLPSKGIERVEYDRRLLAALQPFDPALICLAGFMRVLSTEFVAAYRARILNIHPALLPSFPGLHAQRQALEYGVRITGCTVHLVDEGVDTGRILMQRAVEVLDGDTEESLSSRILQQEHDLFWRAIAQVLDRMATDE